MSNEAKNRVFWGGGTFAPWTTLEVTVTWNVSTVQTTQVNEAGVDECAWSISYTQGVTASHTFTFTREPPHFDDFIQSNNRFTTVRGIAADGFGGFGLTHAAQGDINNKGDTIKTVYVQLCGSDGPGYAQFTDDTTASNSWSEVYTFNGTGDPEDCSMPENSSGTDHPLFGCNLLIEQNENELAISGAVLKGALHFDVGGSTVTDTAFTTPVQIFVHSFKTDPGDDIDFGSTQASHETDPGGFDAFSINESISFVCS